MIRRLTDRPIVAPNSAPGYEAIFNAGLLRRRGTYHLFARGVRQGYRRNDARDPEAPRFLDYVSDILVFTSSGGERYRFRYVLGRSGEGGVYSFEDPRMQWVRSDGVRRLVVTYTDLPPPPTGLLPRIGLGLVAYHQGRFHLEGTHVIGPRRVADKDAVVFNLTDGRVALIHRVQPHIQLAIFTSLDHLMAAGDEYWDDHLACLDDHTILRATNGALGIGAGAPPLATPAGLLLFFHERNREGAYVIKAALLDPATGRVRRALDQPLLTPELEWEINGDVERVIFVQGAARNRDGTIYLTYGAADRAVGAALVREAALLAALTGG